MSFHNNPQISGSLWSFSPKTESEIQEIRNQSLNLLPDGEYSFVVLECKPKVAQQSKNNMLMVKIAVVSESGITKQIIDNLVDTEKMAWKTKHFCESIGFEKEYAAGKLDLSKCGGRAGRAKIGRKKGGLKDDGTYFDDSNYVKDYIPINTQTSKSSSDNFINDDIKF